MIRKQPKGVEFEGNDRYEGFTIDLLKKISEDLKFQYEIVLTNEYGGPRNIQKTDWGGIVGEILAKVGFQMLVVQNNQLGCIHVYNIQKLIQYFFQNICVVFFSECNTWDGSNIDNF
jgi:hypothetical protein